MHDKAIQARTELRLNTDLEEMRQKCEQMKLSKEVDRVEKQQQKQEAEAQHKHVSCVIAYRVFIFLVYAVSITTVYSSMGGGGGVF